MMQSVFQTTIIRLRQPFIFILLMGFGLSSCDRNRFYEQSSTVDPIWIYSDGKTFDVKIADTLKYYNFYINVRNTIDYEFANLYFFIQTDLPDGKAARDTVECQLADYQGKWLGNGSGEFRDNRFLIRKNMRFLRSGNYHFVLKHGMRPDSLKGITDVGIRIEIAK
ncbi:MAG TPA: hypothetical protein DCG69_09480 [Bacteroidales bacterium]|nr:hypothetical protein [Bacteroidales bacterium]